MKLTRIISEYILLVLNLLWLLVPKQFSSWKMIYVHVITFFPLSSLLVNVKKWINEGIDEEEDFEDKAESRSKWIKNSQLKFW
jgi:hypothetical protein